MNWQRKLQNLRKHNQAPDDGFDDDFESFVEADKEAALEKLKSLLLGDERKEIDSVDRRLEHVESFHNDLNVRTRIISEVLIPALDEAAYNRPEGISEALGPAIGAGIRHEMENSREEMVAALHPLAGRLVTSAVSDSFTRLSEQVNQSLESLMSPRGMMLRLKATLTGQSLATLMLAELRASELKRIYLFERRSMALKFVWPEADGPDAPTAKLVEEIRNTVQVLADMGKDDADMPIRALDLNGTHLVVQGSRTHFVAIESKGTLTAHRKGEMSAACLSLLDFAARNRKESGESLNTKAMTIFAQRLAKPKRSKAKGGINPFYLILSAALLGLIAWYGWGLYDGNRLKNRAEAVERHIASAFHDGDVVLEIDTDRSAGRIAVSGVGFGAPDLGMLYQETVRRAAPYDLDFNVAIRDVDGAALQQNEIEARLLQTQNELREARLALTELSAALRAQGERILRFDPTEPLTAWIAQNAIYFNDGDTLRSPESSAAKLDRLAEFMRVLPEQRLLVVGHTDRLGTPAINREIALERAEKVIAEMERRGIPRARFEARNSPAELKAFLTEPGVDSPNRRVEFALAFRGE